MHRSPPFLLLQLLRSVQRIDRFGPATDGPDPCLVAPCLVAPSIADPACHGPFKSLPVCVCVLSVPLPGSEMLRGKNHLHRFLSQCSGKACIATSFVTRCFWAEPCQSGAVCSSLQAQFPSLDALLSNRERCGSHLWFYDPFMNTSVG